jgi:hypothetical protein
LSGPGRVQKLEGMHWRPCKAALQDKWAMVLGTAIDFPISSEL